MKKSRRAARRKGSPSWDGTSPRSALTKPPQFIPTVKLNHIFRFRTLSAAGYTVNSDDLLNLYLVATAAATTARLIQAIKLVKVEIWGNVPALGSTPSDVQCEWTAQSGVASFGPSFRVADTSQGITPAHIVARPPKGSLASFWLQSGQTNGAVLNLAFPTGSVIDLHVQMCLVDQESPTAGQTTAGATVGRVYGGTMSSGATFTPIGLTALP